MPKNDPGQVFLACRLVASFADGSRLLFDGMDISIHALLAESDSKKQQKIGSFVAELAILPLQYALSLDLSKYFRRYSSVFEKLFGAKVPEF